MKKVMFILMAIVAMFTLTGCAGMGMTPSRSNAQTWNIDISESTVYVAGVETLQPTELAEGGKTFLFGGQIVSSNEGEEKITATPSINVSPKAVLTVPSTPTIVPTDTDQPTPQTLLQRNPIDATPVELGVTADSSVP